VQNLTHFEGNENLKITQKTDMIKNQLVELFQLDAEVEESAVLEQVQNILTQVATLSELQNQLVLKDTELETVKNQLVEKDTLLTEKESEITELTTKVDEKEKTVIDLTNQVTEFQAEEVKRQEEKVNTLVDAALVANKITNVEKDDWLDFAKKDYTRTEKLLNSLRPVRIKLSDRMEIENNAGVADKPFTARMKEIEDKAKQKK
jgi:type IV secretory pathway VirJ component